MPAMPDRPSWKARLARALGFDRNPLRRASDRAEAWIRTGLLIILLTGGPVAAVAAGQWTAHAGATQTSARPNAVRPVLVQSAAAPARTAVTSRAAQADAAAGTAVTVWHNRSGRVTRPAQRGYSTFAAVIMALMTLAVTAVALLVVLRLVQGFLDWRRLAAWEAALRRLQFL